MRKKQQGSITVEATIILPIYILTICFVLNFMNIFYTQLVIQQGLNNIASTLAQYVYAVDLVTDVDNLALSDKVTEDAKSLAGNIKSVKNDLGSIVGAFSNFSLDKIDVLKTAGSSLYDTVGKMGKTMKGITKEELMNALVAGSLDVVGGAGIGALMEYHLDAMKVNRNCIDGDISYHFGLDGSNNSDLILTAEYKYKDTLLSMFMGSIPMEQSVVVHPWIGGSTKGLRQK